MLARGLAQRGWQILFVSHPISPLHITSWKDQEFQERLRIHKARGVVDCDGNLRSYVPFTLIPPHSYPITRSAWVHNNWYRLTFPRLVEQVKEQGFTDVDLLYFDNPLQNFWLSTVSRKRAIYRMTDNISGYQKNTMSTIASEALLCRSVDIVLCTARSLMPRARMLGAKSPHYFPNGVELAHFQEDQRPAPDVYAEIASPRVIYVGEMAERFDFVLVKKLAQKLPNVSFIMIGPCSVARKELAGINNVHVLGSVPYDNLPPYIRHSDVGIIPFRVKEKAALVGGVNPLKLYQYLASGIQVVSVKWPEIEGLESPAFLCETDDEFIAAVRRALGNGLIERSAAERVLADKDWSGRVSELEGFVLPS